MMPGRIRRAPPRATRPDALFPDIFAAFRQARLPHRRQLLFTRPDRGAPGRGWTNEAFHAVFPILRSRGKRCALFP